MNYTPRSEQNIDDIEWKIILFLFITLQTKKKS